MKKLTAIILALALVLALTTYAAAESDGLDPAQRHIYQLVTEHDPEPVFHGNFTYWRWEQTIENPADNDEQPEAGGKNCLDAFAFWLKQETNVRKGNNA